MSTCYAIATARRAQIDAEFKMTRSQVSDSTKEGRRQLLNHLSKLSKKTSGHDRSVLRIQGSY